MVVFRLKFITVVFLQFITELLLEFITVFVALLTADFFLQFFTVVSCKCLSSTGTTHVRSCTAG